jgi:hypothetical protein
MTKKFSKRKTTKHANNMGKGITNSRSRADSFNKSRVTPILDLGELIRNRSESFDKSKVTPLIEDFGSLPMESPYKTLSPSMFRLVYEGDLAKELTGENTYDEDGNLIVDFDLPLYDSIDKPGRFSETIYQRPTKYKAPYDIERPNPFWSNSNDDFGQYIELSKSASSDLGRGITKRKYKKHNKRTNKTHKKHSKKSRKSRRM